MHAADIQEGADCYYAAGDPWRAVCPVKATVVSTDRVRITSTRTGAAYITGWTADPAGNAIVVDLHRGGWLERKAVPVRHLRGPWLATLAATGRTEAGVRARRQHMLDLARNVTAGGLLRLAANDPGVDDDTFALLAPAVDGRSHRH